MLLNWKFKFQFPKINGACRSYNSKLEITKPNMSDWVLSTNLRKFQSDKNRLSTLYLIGQLLSRLRSTRLDLDGN